MKNTRINSLHILLVCLALAAPGRVCADLGATVPISGPTATAIAESLFPVAIKAAGTNYLLSEPVVLFLNAGKIGLQTRFQAYDHRPAEGVAISEMGRAQISGKLDFDQTTRQVLLHHPTLDKLEFDRQTEITTRLLNDLQKVWSTQVSDPLRSDIPPHPYLLPFKDNIGNISYDGENINLEILYQRKEY